MTTNKKPELTEQVISFLTENKKLLIGVFLLILVVSVGKSTYDMQRKSQQTEAFSKFYSIEKAIIDLDSKGVETNPKSVKTKSKNQPIDFDKKYGEIESQIKQFIIANKGKNAAIYAGITLSDLYLKNKKDDKALEVIKDLSLQVSREKIYFGLVNINLASAQMNKNQFEKALLPLQEVLSVKSLKYIHPIVLLKMGLCYKELKKPDEARRVFTRVFEEFSGSSSAKTAKSYLRVLNI